MDIAVALMSHNTFPDISITGPRKKHDVMKHNLYLPINYMEIVRGLFG